ncbi:MULTISPECIES: hypothetical protein [unclassified Leifsonia]|uniref:hypothetical protein n=1 Tax=unclassified Leifsonia TaxID=2663824 RepID=UPI0006FEE18C|nr:MULTISPECIES: hypothetical protein [unclassified Leifsonia]KQX06713.1 hypothetical protein ASC59_02395 [Leifsonia sp. Root1293]KRA10997.1 hypothetical protein ASD61_02395 [Leifsonia sp. Root60]
MNETLARAPQMPVWGSLAQSAPVVEPLPEPTPSWRPSITVAPTRDQRRARPRLFYAIVAVSGVAAIFIAKLLLSVALSQGAYESAAAESELKHLQQNAQAVGEDLDRVKSPQYLAENAAALGMVTNAHPAYLRLSDGAVLGQPQAADSATGGAGNAVPNSLLAGVPLVTDPAPVAAEPVAEPAKKTEKSTDAAATETAEAATAAGAGVGPAGIPTPVTH